MRCRAQWLNCSHSATSLVVRAVDHEAADDYGKLFVEFDKEGVVAPNINGDVVPDPTPSAQGQNAAVNEELLKALAKANGGTTTAGTCNNSCHCAIA